MIITFLRFATCFFLLFLICFRTLFISNQKREEKKKDFHRIFVSSVYSEKTKTQHNSVITLSLSLTLHFSLATKPFIILIRKDFFFSLLIFVVFFCFAYKMENGLTKQTIKSNQRNHTHTPRERIK